MPFNFSNLDWGRILAGLGQGLTQAGQPGGGDFSQGLMQGVQFHDQGVDRRRQRQMDELSEEVRRQQLEDTRTANQDAAAEKKRQDDFLASIGNGLMAQGGAGPMQWSPEQIAYFNAYPDRVAEIVGRQLFPAAETADAPVIKDFFEGGKVIQKQWDGKQWVKVGEGARWEPNAPAASGETWVPYVDPVSKRTGQKNTKTGKIDWDPGNTMMTVVGTTPDGQPIYDFVSGAPGPTKEHEVKAANQSLLLGQGLSELERLYNNENVSAWRMAGADALSDKLGPIGNVVGQQVLTAEDKQFISGRARALESLANTITGAAFTEEQKKNFISMLPQPTDDLQTASIKIKQAKEYVAELERNAKVSNRRQGADEGWTDVDGVQIRVKP